MEEVRLLLGRRSCDPDSKAVLLPVFYDMTWEKLRQKANDLREDAAAAGPASDEDRVMWRQWAESLDELKGITGFRPDQVGMHATSRYACVCT